MRKISQLVGLALLLCSFLAFADLIPPRVQTARDRLHANPNTYDRVDNFCQGKKPGASCVIPGSPFIGGGEGTCANNINDDLGSIDLSCVTTYGVTIDRDLPAGGWVDDPNLCALGEDKKTGQKFNCKPMIPAPADRFCRGKQIGSSCSVQFTYKGKKEQDNGVCRKVTETEKYYYQGYRLAKREVVRCEPSRVPQHTYTPANWVQKILQ